jgi:hypothetical protein
MKSSRTNSPCKYVFLSALLLAGMGIATLLAQSLPSTVEDVVNRSDLIVLGKVTSTDPKVTQIGEWKLPFTRHVLKVEAYYKGSGPEEVALFTAGGLETRMEGGKERQLWTKVSGSEQVKVGDEFVAFLQAASGGYVFLEWDGAKYPVYLDGPDSEHAERKVNLRLRKQRYMKGTALQGFKNLMRLEGGPDPASKLEEKLQGTKGVDEVIGVKDLRERLSEIIRGEEPPK